ncbi:MAG: DUF1641 domain-containing protein [Acidimicrobiia bacterium]|nr:DUF1641 domain-containing protein [Acidimicrobiia bacterium]
MTTATISLEDRLERLTDQVQFLVADAQRKNRELQMWRDLGRTVAPMAHEPMDVLVEKLSMLEERGYFEFAKGGLDVIDRIVTAYGEDDIKALGDNVELIFDTIKEMTQPQVMSLLGSTVRKLQEEEAGDTPSLFSILKEMRDPQVRRGLARVLNTLRSVGDTGAKV